MKHNITFKWNFPFKFSLFGTSIHHPTIIPQKPSPPSSSINSLSLTSYLPLPPLIFAKRGLGVRERESLKSPSITRALGHRSNQVTDWCKTPYEITTSREQIAGGEKKKKEKRERDLECVFVCVSEPCLFVIRPKFVGFFVTFSKGVK